MISTDFELHVSARRLLVVLVVALIPLIAVSLYVVTEAEQTGRQSLGMHFANIAKISASDVSRYVQDRIIGVHVLAQAPTVVEAVRAANLRARTETDAAFQQRVERTERIWATAEAAPITSAILGAPASRLFRSQIAADGRLLRMILTDARGAVIAASHKTLDFYQADEEPWQAAYADGRGAVYASAVRFDEVTKRDFVYLAMPVVESESEPFAGVLEVLIDVAGLLPQDTPLSEGSTFRRMLVTGEGRVVSAPGIVFSMDASSPEFASVRETGGGGLGNAGFIVSGSGSQEELIGYADTGLGAQLKNLDLRVLVTQETREALVGVSGLTRLIWILALSAMALLTVAAAYFTLHRRVRYEDVSAALDS